jgi:sterol desaturase/sphingolipid hydroxylase (fatty acid hydroxylase superfamily)
MGDMANYIAMAIPVFFVLIGIELWFARREAREVARLNDAVSDLSCGTLQQVMGLFTKTAVFGVYALIYKSFHLLEISTASAWAWAACFLGVDFLYYWFHRFSHESNFAWAAHVVHHQSEDYNLSVALRQSALQQFISAPFYWPLALLGFPPAMFLAMSAANTLYQFWIHTELIGRLGFLEWFLNTPSHHRVHHGCQPQYIDRNHGGTLIVWDRLFGTFEPEGEEVIYGVTKPPRSWNPIFVNFHYVRELWRLSRKTERWSDKVKVWFKRPGWRPADVGEEPAAESALTGAVYDADAPPPLSRYALVHFAAAMVLAFFFILRFDDYAVAWKAALGLFLVWTLVDLAGVFEARGWLPVSEMARLAVASGMLALGLDGLWALPLLALGIAGLALSAFWLLRHRSHFRPRIA